MKNVDYQQLLDRALRGVVKDALVYAQFNGLGGDGTHFYITFRTKEPGVVIPDFLRLRYPDMMTIVLQHSFSNLNVSSEEFGVTLTFDGRPFYIRVPYNALLEFKDPSVDFMLQFRPREQLPAGNDLSLPLEEKPLEDTGRVVDLDEFRKRRK
ncbi:MAG: ClpXP protease specificity-enhancing factor SspB [Alphaproteobacteria bacterium]|nr:ClpXP protease specificity-enhancing factor SspB [Alphaproteobacteria bacterium]